jgi:cytochrome c oxidase assembly factor CtaG
MEPDLVGRVSGRERSFIMRVLIGIVLGVLLTVGGAYLYDSHYAAAATNTTSLQRPMVNWDVVSNKWNRLTERARAEWGRLTG